MTQKLIHAQRVKERPAGHGPVLTDENHAVIIPRAKVGDKKNSLLGVEGGGFRK